MDLLRFATAGSVDDGKSTLIGRLLLDSKAIFEDQLEAVEHTSRTKGYDYTDLALLTDGLRSEREQGITIDVAYRYFATPQRKFIIADTPGHVEYTRNMVTGASTADLGLVLVDARQGLTEQSRRHAVLLSLLRVPHIVLAVNKMDLVDFDQAVFDRIDEEFTAFAARLDVPGIRVIPVSALQGDNVVEPSTNLPWYEGPALLEYLESVDARHQTRDAARLPVQYVIRPKSDEHHDYRGYAGRVTGGTFRVGDEVVVQPSGQRTTVEAIDLFEKALVEAPDRLSVTLRLADDIDASRGDVIAHAEHAATVGRNVTAMVCWMTPQPLRVGQKLMIKHATRSARAMVQRLVHRLDVNTLLSLEAPDGLGLNEIGEVSLKLSQPLVTDRYADNRVTGSFILIDEISGATVGSGLVL